MLQVATEFPAVGSYAFMDAIDHRGADVVEKVRIQRDNGDGNALISILSRRFPREIASGNRTVPFAQLRATEQAEPIKKSRPRACPKAKAGRRR